MANAYSKAKAHGQICLTHIRRIWVSCEAYLPSVENQQIC